EEVVLMSTDGRRKSVAGSKEIDGAGLAVVARSDTSVLLFGDRQRAIDLRNGGRHLLPPKLVGEMLWHRRATMALFRDRYREGKCCFVPEQRLDGQDRQH